MYQFLGKTTLELLFLFVNQTACILLGQLVDDPVGPTNIRKVIADIRARLENSLIEELVLSEDQLLRFLEIIMWAVKLVIKVLGQIR